MMRWNGSWSGSNWLAMGLLMLLFMSLIVGAAFLLVPVWRRRGSDPTPAGEEPQRILDRSYAGGEISEDEYTRRRKLLHTA